MSDTKMTGNTSESHSSPHKGDEKAATFAKNAGEFAIGNDLRVTRLGYGAMRITGTGVWGEPADRAGAIKVLRRAEALYPYPDNLVIATKGGFARPGPNKWVENGKPEHLRSVCEGSLKRLRLERIDLYQLHRIDPKVPAEDQFGTLKKLAAEGKIKHIGLSEVSVEQIQHAQKFIPIVSVQNRYSLSDRGSEDVLKYCEQENIAFIPWFPLAAGKLSKEQKLVQRVAGEQKASPSQIALAWLLARSPVILPIPGTSSVEHLEENVAAAGVKLDEKEMQELSKAAHA
jgi:pyridoxine 4-dehydrogenase